MPEYENSNTDILGLVYLCMHVTTKCQGTCILCMKVFDSSVMALWTRSVHINFTTKLFVLMSLKHLGIGSEESYVRMNVYTLYMHVRT